MSHDTPVLIDSQEAITACEMEQRFPEEPGDVLTHDSLVWNRGLQAGIEILVRLRDAALGRGETPEVESARSNEGHGLEGRQGKPDAAGVAGNRPVPLPDASSVTAPVESLENLQAELDRWRDDPKREGWRQLNKERQMLSDCREQLVRVNLQAGELAEALTERDLRIVELQRQLAVGRGVETPPQEPHIVMTAQDVEHLRVNCLGTYGGGHHDDGKLGAFQHGMETVCNVLMDMCEKAAQPAAPPTTEAADEHE